MAESKATTNSWRTDAEVRDEHDRLATIYRQRGLSVLIETVSDEIVKLRRAAAEMKSLIDSMLAEHAAEMHMGALITRDEADRISRDGP